MRRRDLARRTGELRALLERLAVGGRVSLIELADWEDYLNARAGMRHSGMARWFLCALRHEWQHASPPSGLCAALTEDVGDIIGTQPGPWATVWGHTLRVAGNATWLAERSGIDPEAAYLAALYHDVGKLEEWGDSGLPHAELGAREAIYALRGELPRRVIGNIANAIRIHPERPAPSWGVARVLHDADKLDKVGATGLLRRVSKTEDLDEACVEAERTLDDVEMFPVPCLSVSNELLRPKLVFTRTLEEHLYEVCP